MKSLLAAGLIVAFVICSLGIFSLFMVNFWVGVVAAIGWYQLGPSLVVVLNERIESS